MFSYLGVFFLFILLKKPSFDIKCYIFKGNETKSHIIKILSHDHPWSKHNKSIKVSSCGLHTPENNKTHTHTKQKYFLSVKGP